MDPLTQGDYPFSMRVLAGDRLPKFTKEQSDLVKGSFDFVGLNYYTASYVYSTPISNSAIKNYNTDSYTNTTGKLPLIIQSFQYANYLTFNRLFCSYFFLHFNRST